MRRITLWLLSTISALVILFSYSTSLPARTGTSAVAEAAPAQASTTESTSTSGSTGSTGGSTTDASASEQASSTPTTEQTAAAAPTTVTGDVVQTRYGPVQVEVTVEAGHVTDVQVLQVPWSNGRDQQINGYAVPILIEETTAADSAEIDMVSGATYTSRGYVESLQSALDQL